MFFRNDEQKFDQQIKQWRKTEHGIILDNLRKEQIKKYILANLDSTAETSAFPKRLGLLERRRTMTTILSVLIGLSMIGGTTFASTEAAPGDALFPIKKVVERMQVAVHGDEQTKAELKAKFAEKRVAELERARAEANVHAEAEAKVEAKAGLSHAIEALTKVEAKLEARGNTEAAEAVRANIERLQARVDVVEDREDDDGDDETNSDTDRRHERSELRDRLEDIIKHRPENRTEAEAEHEDDDVRVQSREHIEFRLGR